MQSDPLIPSSGNNQSDIELGCNPFPQKTKHPPETMVQ